MAARREIFFPAISLPRQMMMATNNDLRTHIDTQVIGFTKRIFVITLQFIFVKKTIRLHIQFLPQLNSKR